MTMFPLFQPASDTALVGKRGERTALLFLLRLGYRILGQNVRVGLRDEIDLIAFDPIDDVIVFAEVKSRKKFHPDYRPELNLTLRKRTALARAARAWIADCDWEGGYRIDVVCVAEDAVIAHYPEVAWIES